MSSTGHVLKRCPCAPRRDAHGRRVNCAKRHGTWSFVHELPPGSDGGRRQVKRGGFSTAADARRALTDSLAAVARGYDTRTGRVTVGAYSPPGSNASPSRANCARPRFAPIASIWTLTFGRSSATSASRRLALPTCDTCWMVRLAAVRKGGVSRRQPFRLPR